MPRFRENRKENDAKSIILPIVITIGIVIIAIISYFIIKYLYTQYKLQQAYSYLKMENLPELANDPYQFKSSKLSF